jgi:diguanylate cyclase (GGDEF)-like protein
MAAPQGSLVARLGGDEFVITLSGTHIKKANLITQQIIAAIREPILLTSDLPPVELDAAIGKALFPNDAKTAEDLIKHADLQMYKAKKAR